MVAQVIAGVSIVCGVGGVAYGYDQHRKRRDEQKRHREELAGMEAQLRDVEVRFGRQTEQFRILAAEVERLRRANVA